MASLFHTENGQPNEPYAFPSQIFHAVVEENYDGLANIFAENARNSVISYLSMKSRWARQQDYMAKSEEKIDDFLQHASYSKSPQLFSSSAFDPKQQNDGSNFYSVLQQLSVFVSEHKSESKATHEFKATSSSNPYVDFNHGSKNVHRLIWEACSTLAGSRPPSNLCIYDRSGATTPLLGHENYPPIYDGSVANATPAPHGGVGASGGTGTILHLLCAMDRPLMLAFLLIMGADGRANHTAFRRLMIHEAACNGSINCLTLLLEMGHRYANEIEEKNRATSGDKNIMPFFPDAMERSSPISSKPAPRLATRPPPPISIDLRQFGKTYTVEKENEDVKVKCANCMPILCQFKSLAKLVKEGNMTELQAARSLLAHAHILEATRTALIRSCTFGNDTLYSAHSFFRPI